MSLETSEQSADRSPSSRGVKKFRFSHMQQSTAYLLFFRGVQRRCVWAVGRLGVAAAFLACVSAAAVDWQARQSCLGWCGGVN